jgi:hypothetical protein
VDPPGSPRTAPSRRAKEGASMIRGPRATALAAATWIAALGGAVPARAITVELPGERNLEVHGWYELRLRAIGDDLPSNDVTFSQFRHVLNIETELPLFPDGVGPLDFMLAYARFQFGYECIYDHACGLVESADAYGGEGGRTPRSLPANVRRGVSGEQFVGATGLLRRTDARNLTPPQEVLNPGGRPRGPINPSGISANPNPSAGLANLNARSRTDAPIDQFAASLVKTRAASFTSDVNYGNYIVNARARIGDDNFLDLFDRLTSGSGVGFLADGGQGRLRVLNRQILEATQSGADPATLQSLVSARDRLLFRDPNDPNSVRLDHFFMDPVLQEQFLYPTLPDGQDRNLLLTRPDLNVFELMAQRLAPELLTTTFGQHALPQRGGIPYRATIGSAIRPLGFLTGADAVDIVNNSDIGVATSLIQLDTTTLPGGLSRDDSAQNNVVPLFVGPDGRFNTADDLPQTRDQLSQDLEFEPDIPQELTAYRTTTPTATGPVANFSGVVFVRGTLDERTGSPLVLGAVGNEDAQNVIGCRNLGGTLEGALCTDRGTGNVIDPAAVLEEGCVELTGGGSSGAGINAQGECFVLNNQRGSTGRGVNFNEIPYLNDLRFRPATAPLEPPDLTDFKGFAVLGQPPVARPRAPSNSVAFKNPGAQRLLKSTHHLVSNLDLDFTVDELQWGHGASDDEHELREAYLEFEMANNQVFTRVGKQLMVWGKTEIFRGQDRLNPQDLSDGFGSSLQESRVGQWGVDLVLSPTWATKVGPLRDLRLEGAMLWDDFEPGDLGVCGETGAAVGVCAKLAGAYAHGLTGIGLIGEDRPQENLSGWDRYEYGVRLEGHWDRFAFSLTDYWGWDDAPITEVVFEYQRRVDPETGALVNPTGPRECNLRTGPGGVLVGPDGDPATTYDNDFPSVGNCLLFDDPTDPNAAQPLRADADIAANHLVNQTLFHTVCALTFDPDRGYCAFDQANDPDSFTAIAQILSGIQSGVQTLAAEGVDTIRFKQQGPTAVAFTKPGSSNQASEAARQLFRPIDPALTDIEDSLVLRNDQGALLGCGPAFVSACGGRDEEDFASNPAFKKLVGVPPDPTSRANGGIDFMNAEGSVITQEFAVLKALQPGAPVAITNDADGRARYQAGVSLAGRPVIEAQASGIEASDLFPLDLLERDQFLRARVNDDPNTALRNDAWVEPFPWKVDQEVLQQEGLLVFKVANQSERDPRCDPSADGRARDITGEAIFTSDETAICTFLEPIWASDPNRIVLNDPTDPTNPANEFQVDFTAFTDPDDPNADPDDPNDLLHGTLADVIGQTSVFQKWVRSLERTSENCTQFINGSVGGAAATVAGTFFDEGCTELETVSANFERFFNSLEQIGGDRIFDPPETLEELLNMVDNSFINDQFGDPISGPDGIVTRNLRIFADPSQADQPLDEREPGTVNDVHGLRFASSTGEVASLDTILPTLDVDEDGTGGEVESLSEITLAEFFEALNAESVCTAISQTSRCFAQVGVTGEEVGRGGQFAATTPDAAALPIGIQSNFSRLNGELVPAAFRPAFINMWELFEKRPLEFASFWAGEFVVIENEDENGNPLPMDDPRRIRLKYDRPSTGGPLVLDFESIEVRAFPNVLEGLKGQFFNPSGISTAAQPLDNDRDGVYDGQDDGSPGPISDDSILCGSGLVGDVLQEGGQFEFFSLADEQAFAAMFPNGLPRRSPVNCGTASAVLGGTGITLPFRRAGGDGRYGRRAFQWHGGRELVLTYEKRNVLGFGLDFAHDPSRTSWNVELSWDNDLHIGNTNAPSGLSNTDQYVLAVSVDRPTFFRFLNPSRTFFLNYQIFVRYLTDYDGGADDHDGNYGYAEGPLSTQMSFTFFTGYFQDRLTPRTTFLWDPTADSYGLAWGLGYRFRNNLTADVRVNHFFGETQTVRRAFFPNSLFTDPRTLGGSGRGFANVYNEDSAGFAIRYSW